MLTPGAKALKRFLDDNSLTLTAVGQRVGVSHVAVRSWSLGLARPDAHQRDKIEQLTKGAVPRDSWRTRDEQRELERVQPLQPTGTDND